MELVVVQVVVQLSLIRQLSELYIYLDIVQFVTTFAYRNIFSL